MTQLRMTEQSINVNEVAGVEVAPGITRRILPTTASARAWLIEFEPATQWPEDDVHVGEERYFVLSGEVIEGDRKYGPGTYVVFADGSSHRPRSDIGASMLGINIPAVGIAPD